VDGRAPVRNKVSRLKARGGYPRDISYQEWKFVEPLLPGIARTARPRKGSVALAASCPNLAVDLQSRPAQHGTRRYCATTETGVRRLTSTFSVF